MPRIWYRQFGMIAPLVIIAMTSVLGFQAARIQTKLEVLQSAPHDNVQWNLAQAEIETLVLLNAISSVDAQSAQDSELIRIKRRFDILYSRVTSIDASSNFATLKDQAAFSEIIEAILDKLKALVPIIDGDDEQLLANLQNVYDEIAGLRPNTRKLALIGVDTFAEQGDTQRGEFSALLRDTAQLGLVLFSGLLIAIILMLRQRRLANLRANAVRESQSRYESTINASLDAIIVADANGIILEFNPAAEKTFGYSRARAVGADMSELIIPEHLREGHRTGMKRFRENGEQRVVGKGRVELTAMDANGREFPIEISIGSAEQTDNMPILISNIRDISERKRIESELLDARDRAQQADSAKSRFLAVTSHEMRTPLNGVMAVLDLMSATPLSNTQRDYLDTAVTSGEILQHHIDTVLDITRIESGAIELVARQFDVSDLLREVYQSYSITADKNWNTIEVSIDEEVGVVALDRDRLRQILLNMVGNALKFTEYGLISVHVGQQAIDEHKRELVFTVRDTGCGIAEENLSRIFDDFVTVDASYGRKANGYGLGLSICRRIATAMGGTISVESEIDVGTVFTIRLPEADPALVKKESAPADNNNFTDFNLNVLIVEDNETNRRVASAMLEQFGCRVRLAVDGEDGLEKAAEGDYDLVFMDLSMPKMDGLEAVERIRAQAILPDDVPIVFLTAHAMKEEEERMKAAGVEHVLMKPLRRRNLSSLLSKLFPAKKKAEKDVAVDDDTGDVVVDLSFVEEMRDLMDPAEVASAINKFCDELSLGIEELETLNRQGDLEGARILAHRIGGSSAMFGGLALAEALRLVQDLANQGDDASISELIPDIGALSKDVVDVLRHNAAR